MWSSSNFKLTWNLLIMSIVGRLYGFKVITRTFLDFASNSVYIWCTYTSNSQDPFPKFDLTTHKIPLQFWWSSFWLDQSLFLVSVSLQVFRLILILWDSQQAIVTQFETMILWWLSSSVHKMILWNIYIYIYIYIYWTWNTMRVYVYNATLAQTWPRGVHTLHKHMQEVHH